MKLEVRGILFDMDGVLVSSLGSVERSWAIWGERHGIDGAEAIKTAHGKRIIEDLECEDVGDIRILAGVESLLQSLPEGHWTIVTSATERLARARLAQAGLTMPEKMITADMVTLGKPNPEPYLRGAQLLGFRPEDCLVIEDATAGTQAGRAAGCKVLATLFSHTREQLPAADWIVDSLEGVEVRPTSRGIELTFEPVAMAQAV
jgi:sugar-phosphatase